MHVPTRSDRRRVAALLLATGTVCLQISCANRPDEADAPGVLRAQDFRASPGSTPDATESAPTAARPDPAPMGDEEVSEGLLSLEALVGPPPDAAGVQPALAGDPSPDPAPNGADAGLIAHVPDRAAAAAPPQGQIIDSLVGQINGQPVYASEFFAQIDNRLTVLAGQVGEGSVWIMQAREIIARHLNDRIRDELLLAEAQSSLTPAQRQGLIGFFQHLRSEEVSRAGGGEAAVDIAIREKGEKGQKGLDQAVQDRLQAQLIANELRTRVSTKVNVSWRDVQLEYERRFDEFNPPTTAVFITIMVVAENVVAVDDITTRLASGEAFGAVAAGEGNLYKRDAKGVDRIPFKGEFAAGVFFSPVLNENATTLHPGQTIGPIAFSGMQAWIHLEKIEQLPARSLYDVQYTLFRDLRDRRFIEEGTRFLKGLYSRGSYSDLQAMEQRLLAIASDRYLPSRK